MKKNRHKGFAKKNKKANLPVLEGNLPVPEGLANGLNKQVNTIVPEAQGKQISDRTRALIKAEMFKGPFPHPEHVTIYEQSCPGFLNRSLTMAENAQESQIQHNTRIIAHKIFYDRLCVVFAFFLFLASISAAVTCALTGHDWVAVSFVSAGGLGFAGAIAKFIRDKKG